MTKTKMIAPLMAATAMIAGFSAPAHAAGKAERARQAIAAAQAKIDTAEQLGTAEFRPGETAQAKAALAHAQENLSAGHKPEAIDDAIHASALADTAIGMMQKHKAELADRQSAAAVADAQAQAQAAQSQADAANARADVATAAAQSSAADAAVARQAAAVALTTPQPAPATVETTVTTQGAARAPVKKVTVKKVARRTTHTPVRTASAAGTVTTTTRITQGQ
jgi:hypothetical protein